MTNSESLLSKDEVEQIRNESRSFIKEARKVVQHSKRLTNDASQKIEELMILKEERIANKCESMAILRLAIQRTEKLGLVFVSGNVERGIADDTRIALEMLGEIKLAVIPDENSDLHALRSRLLGLSFLPT